VTVTVLNAPAAPPWCCTTTAQSHTIENSLRKAYTSLTFRTPSGEFGKRVTSSPTGAGALHLDKVTSAGGCATDPGRPGSRRLDRDLRGAWGRQGRGVRTDWHRPHRQRARWLTPDGMARRTLGLLSVVVYS